MTKEEAAKKLDLVTTYDIPDLREAVRMAQAALLAQAEAEKIEPLTVDALFCMHEEKVYLVSRRWRTGWYMCYGGHFGPDGKRYIQINETCYAEELFTSGEVRPYRRKPEVGTT